MWDIRPEDSPWGEIQSCHELCPGVVDVSTAGHGGIMVRAEVTKKLLSPSDQKCAFQDGGYLCFEEDCASAVVLWELIHKRHYKAPVNEYYKPGEFVACLEGSIQQYYPEYWKVRGKKLASQQRHTDCLER